MAKKSRYKKDNPNKSPNRRQKKRILTASPQPKTVVTLGRSALIIDNGFNIFYILFLITLWFFPQRYSIDTVYNTTLMILFEFVFIHISTMMAIANRGLFFIIALIILGGITAIFHLGQIDSSAILYIYLSTIINRVILGRCHYYNLTTADKGFTQLRIYVFCFIAAMFLSALLPQGGITQHYLELNHYFDIIKITGATEMPRFFIQFGIIYYSVGLLWERGLFHTLLFQIKSIKKGR